MKGIISTGKIICSTYGACGTRASYWRPEQAAGVFD